MCLDGLPQPVALHLFDSDWSPVPGSVASDDFCGIAFVPLDDAFVVLDEEAGVTEEALRKKLSLPDSVSLLPHSVRHEYQGTGQNHDGKSDDDDDEDDDDDDDDEDDKEEDDGSPDTVFPGHRPKWYPFMFEVPGDGQGRILASVEIIPILNSKAKKNALAIETKTASRKETVDYDAFRPLLPDIRPPTRQAWLEIVAVGCRDLKPFRLLPMQLPHVTFTIDTPKGPITHSTKESKQPTPK